jgi:hypothetical protein
LGDVRSISGAPPWSSKWPAKGGVFCIFVLFAVTLVAAGQYGASSHLMAVLSSFYKSPGLHPSVDAHGIRLVHRHGHHIGLQRRCICSPPAPISIDVIIAKDHVMVH